MGKTLEQYLEWLDGRNLRWPQVMDIQPLKATPSLKPLGGIRAVSWNPYGTLVRITDGQLMFDHPQEMRMQIAFEKTLEEFNFWYSMSRKPGAPWKYLSVQYRRLLDEQRLASARKKGDYPEINAGKLWEKYIERLMKNKYSWDESLYGDRESYAEKIAYFFHASLQGVTASPNASRIVSSITQSGLKQALMGNGQSFTKLQIQRALSQQESSFDLRDYFSLSLQTLSHQVQLRTPSVSFYQNAISRFAQSGISPKSVLHVGTRLEDDLISAKQAGFRTVLYVCDKPAVQLEVSQLADPAIRPDRLITDLWQLRDILQIA